MAKATLASSVDVLLKLRDDIGNVLSGRASELQNQLSRLGDYIGVRKKRRRGSSLKGRRAAVKYRDGSGKTWAGRGAQPVAARRNKSGCDIGRFCLTKTAASRKSAPRKSKKRRKAKR